MPLSTPPSSVPPGAPERCATPTRQVLRNTVTVMAVFAALAMIVHVLTVDGAARPQTFETYQAQDQSGQAIDCERLMNDLQPMDTRGFDPRPTGLVADREAAHHYTFKACRSAIDGQLAQFCQAQAADTLSGYDLRNPLDPRCVAPVRQALLVNEPILSVAHGWATVGALRLQTSQIVSVDVQPVSGFELDDQAPQYLTITTADKRDSRHVYVLHDVATTQRWLHALTGSAGAP